MTTSSLNLISSCTHSCLWSVLTYIKEGQKFIEISRKDNYRKTAAL